MPTAHLSQADDEEDQVVARDGIHHGLRPRVFLRGDGEGYCGEVVDSGVAWKE